MKENETRAIIHEALNQLNNAVLLIGCGYPDRATEYIRTAAKIIRQLSRPGGVEEIANWITELGA